EIIPTPSIQKEDIKPDEIIPSPELSNLDQLKDYIKNNVPQISVPTKNVQPALPKDVEPVPPKDVIPVQPKVEKTNPSPSSHINVNSLSDVEQAIFNQVNVERSKVGLPLLSYNKTMEKYARIKSKDMGDKNYFSHEDLQGNLITVQMDRDGVKYKAWGENIASRGGSINIKKLSDQFMTQWMNSSGHRANILSTDFQSIGVGLYQIGNEVFATQEFYK
ncbi:MAG: CAP domain-containing protein, partial [Sarcina sp.]